MKKIKMKHRAPDGVAWLVGHPSTNQKAEVRFLMGVHAWVEGFGARAEGSLSVCLSHSDISLPPFHPLQNKNKIK